MVDFTSALYLGFRHGSNDLPPWAQLTLGVPAALTQPPGAQGVANRLARLQGCARATLAPSTLHLFWDLFGLLARAPIALYVDAGAYPIAQWGVERAAAQGVPITYFPHRDVAVLAGLLQQRPGRRKPIIVTDGICTVCGCTAPVAAYFDLVRAANGLLIIDDTQALGLLGAGPESAMPYGYGGGGSLPYSAIRGPQILVISSLAKALGVPVAVLAGSERLVRSFERHSETRLHCSPPSAATIQAAARALVLNSERGDDLRMALADRVRHWHRLLAAVGLAAEGGLFPVQTIKLPPAVDVQRLYRWLHSNGIQAIPRRAGHNSSPRLSFIITTQHRFTEIEYAVATLAHALSPHRLSGMAKP